MSKLKPMQVQNYHMYKALKRLTHIHTQPSGRETVMDDTRHRSRCTNNQKVTRCYIYTRVTYGSHSVRSIIIPAQHPPPPEQDGGGGIPYLTRHLTRGGGWLLHSLKVWVLTVDN